MHLYTDTHIQDISIWTTGATDLDLILELTTWLQRSTDLLRVLDEGP